MYDLIMTAPALNNASYRLWKENLGQKLTMTRKTYEKPSKTI